MTYLNFLIQDRSLSNDQKRLKIVEKWLSDGKINEKDFYDFRNLFSITEDIANGFCISCESEERVFCGNCSKIHDQLCFICAKQMFEDEELTEAQLGNDSRLAHLECVEKANEPIF